MCDGVIALDIELLEKEMKKDRSRDMRYLVLGV